MELSKEQLAEIEREAKALYPYMTDSPSSAISLVKYNEHQDTAREAYTAAASKYLVRIKELEDGLRLALDNQGSVHLFHDELSKLLTK